MTMVFLIGNEFCSFSLQQRCETAKLFFKTVWEGYSQVKKPHRETHHGLRPLSMPQKTFDIVVCSMLIDLFARILFLGIMKGIGGILAFSFWIMIVLPVVVAVLWFKVYESMFGLEPFEGKRKQDKPFIIGFFAAYFILPYILALAFELYRGHMEFLNGTGLFILLLMGIAAFDLIFIALDYLRFRLFKKEYLKNKAIVSPLVMNYINKKYSGLDIRPSKRQSAVSSKFESKKHNYVYYDNYEINYKDFGVLMIFPFVIRRRFKKKYVNFCFFPVDYYCAGDFLFTFAVEVSNGKAISDNFEAISDDFEVMKQLKTMNQSPAQTNQLPG